MTTAQQPVAAVHAANPGPRPEFYPRDPLAFQEPLTAPTPSLHPAVIEAIDGYDSSTSGYVAAAHEAFKKAHESIQHVIDARIAVTKNTDWSPEQRLLKVAELAAQRQDQATKAFDSALKRLGDGIKSFEDMLTRPMQEKSGLGSINSEIRAHAKALKAGEREKFLNEALEQKDTSTLLALCGGTHYLSGLSRERHAMLVRQYNELTQPEAAKRLRVMLAARQHIESKGPLILTQIEQALGWKWQKVQDARARHKAAEDVLKIA